MDKLTVILYNPGAAGDMVANVIDTKDYVFQFNRMAYTPNSYRMKLVMAHFDGEPNSASNFANSGYSVWDKLSVLLKEITEQKLYTAIASHDFAYFAIRQHKYNVILIDDSDPIYCDWALARANKIAPKVHLINDDIINMRKGIFKLQFPEHQNIIYLRDILEGNLIKVLSKMVDTPLNSAIYEHWLSLQDSIPKIDK